LLDISPDEEIKAWGGYYSMSDDGMDCLLKLVNVAT